MKYAIFAQAYGESGYGQCTYGDDQAICAPASASGSTVQNHNNTSTGTPPGSGGGVSGVTIIWLAFLVVICLVICAGAIARAWQ